MATTSMRQAPGTAEGKRPARRTVLRVGEAAITGWVYLCGLTAIVLVALIFLFVLREALPLLKTYPVGKFLTGKEWSPSPPSDEMQPDFGLLPLLLSSLLITLGAVALAIPLGIASAICIGEIVPRWLREILKPTVEMLAAVPSVILGFFGLLVLGPMVQAGFHLSSGVTMLTGAILLAFMAIPTIATISEDALASIPRDVREGSLGLGATHWQTIQRVILPAALPGIVAACMIGVGRAIGETMVVLMVTGNNVGGNLNDLMDGKGGLVGTFQHVFGAYGELCRTLTGTIAAEMGEVSTGDDHYRALFLLGVVLFVITFIINGIAGIALRRASARTGVR